MDRDPGVTANDLETYMSRREDIRAAAPRSSIARSRSPRTRRTRLQALAATAALLLAVTAFTACGGGGERTGDTATVAQVGDMSITRGTLSHWMSTIIGGDYDENIGHPAPRGLVSDPPNYPRCIAAIETLGPSKSHSETPQQARTTLANDCHGLYRELKHQALSYLLQGLWSTEEAAEQGIAVTNAEVERAFAKLRVQRYPTNTALASFLAGREWALSDELYLLKRDLLYAKLGVKHEQDIAKIVKGNHLALERAVLELDARVEKSWKAKTTCSVGYVIPECKQYKGTEALGAPDALLEHIVASR